MMLGPTNSGELQIVCSSRKVRLNILRLLLDNGYKWHGEMDNYMTVDYAYPFEQWPVVKLGFKRKYLSGRMNILMNSKFLPVVTAREFLRLVKTGGIDEISKT